METTTSKLKVQLRNSCMYPDVVTRVSGVSALLEVWAWRIQRSPPSIWTVECLDMDMHMDVAGRLCGELGLGVG